MESNDDFHHASDWSNSEWKHYMEVARNYAKRTDRRVDPDEFMSFACEKMLKGRKAKIKYLFIDFVRQYYGDTRCTGSIKRSDTCFIGLPEDYDYGNIRDDSESSRPDFLFDESVRMKEKRNKILFFKKLKLCLVDGMTFYVNLMKEIGLSEEEICSILDMKKGTYFSHVSIAKKRLLDEMSI